MPTPRLPPLLRLRDLRGETLEGGRERSGKPRPSRRRGQLVTPRSRYAVGRSVAHTGPRPALKGRRSCVRGFRLPTPLPVAAEASGGRFRGFPLYRLAWWTRAGKPGRATRRCELALRSTWSAATARRARSPAVIEGRVGCPRRRRSGTMRQRSPGGFSTSPLPHRSDLESLDACQRSGLSPFWGREAARVGAV